MDIMRTTSSNTIAKEIKAGNRLAFSQFFRENYNRYVVFVLRYVDTKSDATDIVQDVFVKLWEKKHSIDINKSLSAYVYTSVRNGCLNFIRDHKSKYTALDGELVDQSMSLDVDEDSSISVEALIEELPERQREAFQLSRFDGLQHDEIADIMEVSPRTVNNHIVAALKNLRDIYDRHRQKSAMV